MKAIKTAGLLLSLIFAGALHAMPSFSDLIVFGDSLSDNGNAALLAPPTLPPYTGLVPSGAYASGTFSDGLPWSSSVAAALGLSDSPSVLGGHNFAVGGSRAADVAAQAIGGGLLPDYLTTVGGAADPNALYGIWAGGNDLRDILGGADPTTTITGVFNSMAAMITGLAASGADEFLVFNAPDLGLVPGVSLLGAAAAAQATALSAQFNAQLDSLLNVLASGLGVTIHQVDIFSLINQVVANPAAYGLANVGDPCINVGAVSAPFECANPGQYLFWDGIHPTAAGQAIIADSALDVLRAAYVSSPAVPALWLAAFFAWGLGRRYSAGRSVATK